jgi:hypothetical protein
MALNSNPGAPNRRPCKWLMECYEWLVIVMVRSLRILNMGYALCLVLLAVVSDLHNDRPREIYCWGCYFKSIIQNSWVEFKC